VPGERAGGVLAGSLNGEVVQHLGLNAFHLRKKKIYFIIYYYTITVAAASVGLVANLFYFILLFFSEYIGVN
jgi:hypothetical protein